jgi:hypothetical protein
MLPCLVQIPVTSYTCLGMGARHPLESSINTNNWSLTKREDEGKAVDLSILYPRSIQERRSYLSSRLSHHGRPLQEENFTNLKIETEEKVRVRRQRTLCYDNTYFEKSSRPATSQQNVFSSYKSSTRSKSSSSIRISRSSRSTLPRSPKLLKTETYDREIIDGYLKKIQQLMRSQTLRSRQLAVSQVNRLLDKYQPKQPKYLKPEEREGQKEQEVQEEQQPKPKIYNLMLNTEKKNKSSRRRGLQRHLLQNKRSTRSGNRNANHIHSLSTASSEASTISLSQFAFDSIHESLELRKQPRHLAKLMLYPPIASERRESPNAIEGNSFSHEKWNNNNNHSKNQEEKEIGVFITKDWQSQQVQKPVLAPTTSTSPVSSTSSTSLSLSSSPRNTISFFAQSQKEQNDMLMSRTTMLTTISPSSRNAMSLFAPLPPSSASKMMNFSQNNKIVASIIDFDTRVSSPRHQTEQHQHHIQKPMMTQKSMTQSEQQSNLNFVDEELNEVKIKQTAQMKETKQNEQKEQISQYQIKKPAQQSLEPSIKKRGNDIQQQQPNMQQIHPKIVPTEVEGWVTDGEDSENFDDHLLLRT